jgi:NAD(P)-dependent dehydrogenase (short-subunit alcohol dehydrogenase family)
MDEQTPRSALITGSTSGIGEAAAVAFARAGFAVVVNGRDQARADAAAGRVAEASGSTHVRAVAADVATAEGAQTLIDAFGEIDVLVNNAGVFEPTPVLEISDEEWLGYFEVNVLSGIRLARHYLPGMVRRGWGRVIFVSSDSALLIPTEMVHYGVTKTAQLAVARGLAQEVKGTGVTVNTVLPGPTLTPGCAT